VLPNLLQDEEHAGLPSVFHDEVREICERMGGPESDLRTMPESTTIQSSH